MTEVWEDVFCPVCGEPFDRESWDVRHTWIQDGISDVHEGCCPLCQDEP